MFLELTEALDCPTCQSGFGLVAFVDEAHDRRVTTGWLGCPMCEIEIPIEAGTIHFIPSSEAPTGTPSPDSADVLSDFNPTEDIAVRLAALLGLSEQKGIKVLLGPGLADYALPVVRFGERVEVVAWVEGPSSASFSLDELAEGINPMRSAPDRPWPIRMGSFHGLALKGPAVAQLEEATRCVRLGGRVVVLDPTADDFEAFAAGAFEELARDDSTWVGRRR